MKKTIKALALATLIGLAPQAAQAQGVFSKMKEKLENASVPKGAYYYYYENIGKQEKAKEVLVNQSFSVVDENGLAWKGTSKYGGDPDKTYKKIDLAGMKQAVFNDGDFHNTIIKIQDDVFFKIYFQGQTCEMKTISTIEVFSTNKEFIKEIQKDDKCENYKKLETALADFIKANDAVNAAKKAEGDKAEAERVAKVKLPAPTKTNPCNQAKLQELCQKRVGNDKIAYCYFGIPDYYNKTTNNSTNEWKMRKEKKTVNGTYDDFITKREIWAICVYQTEENIKDGVYNHMGIVIQEEHAFDVWDGSKFNGELKASSSAYIGRITKENAFQYKDVLK